jgi:HK97 family phage major capsid protein
VDPLEKLRAQRLAKDAEITRLMGLPVAEKRDATVEEVGAIATLDDELVALDDAITRAERREADKAKEAESRGIVSKPPGEAPAIGTAKVDQKPYSIVRAIQMEILKKPLDGLEAEVAQETVRRSGGRNFKGIAIPTSLDPEMRALQFPAHAAAIMERRDFTTTTGAASIYTSPKTFIELLRARQVVRKLGVEQLDDVQGVFGMTRQTGANTLQWVGEGVSASPTNITEDQILFSPKLAIATSIISKQLVMQTSFSAQEKTEKDLSKVIALGYDSVVFVGTGGAQPLGIFNNPTIQALSASLARGTNGGPLDFASVVRMRGLVASANADFGRMAYVLNSAVETTLRYTVKQAPGAGSNVMQSFMYEDSAEAGIGTLNGMRAFATNLIPATFVKGTSSTCSGICFGNWEDYTVATWDTGLDMIVDPYTGKRSGAVEVTMEMAMDAHPMHEASFTIISDVVTS